MHCDDKRTISALKQYILDASSELQNLKKQLNNSNSQKQIEIQNRVDFLQKEILESKEQLSLMKSQENQL